MDQNKINIISFDVPYPANYGGVIDVFYKIKTLYEAGYEIILHCFQYGRQADPHLEEYCNQVYYYKRKKGIKYTFSPLPYIVITRINSKLIKNLKKNNYPILFEGMHTCGIINHPVLQDRKKIIRMHNVEHSYYDELAKATKNPVKKLYYKSESRKLLKFENIISNAYCIAAISNNDHDYYSRKHNKSILLHAFHPFKEVRSKTGTGEYFLYHGNLDVEENEKAVLFLIHKVFADLDIKFIIAGKSKNGKIKKEIEPYAKIDLITNPDDERMTELIMNAQCCILPTFQTTGIKLKLLISLFNGRHVIANQKMTENTGLESLCKIAGNSDEFKFQINNIKNVEFTVKDIDLRKKVLSKFSNMENIKNLTTVLDKP